MTEWSFRVLPKFTGRSVLHVVLKHWHFGWASSPFSFAAFQGVSSAEYGLYLWEQRPSTNPCKILPNSFLWQLPCFHRDSDTEDWGVGDLGAKYVYIYISSDFFINENYHIDFLFVFQFGETIPSVMLVSFRCKSVQHLLTWHQLPHYKRFVQYNVLLHKPCIAAYVCVSQELTILSQCVIKIKYTSVLSAVLLYIASPDFLKFWNQSY